MTHAAPQYAIRRKADGVLMVVGNSRRVTGKMLWGQPGHAKNAYHAHLGVRIPGEPAYRHVGWDEQDVYEIVLVSLNIEGVVQ